jgi:hypothetical protein
MNMGSARWRPTVTATLAVVILGTGVLPEVSTTLAQGSTSAAVYRLDGLRVLAARRVTVEGKEGIEVDFDAQSAERLVHFTVGVVGRRVAVMVLGRRLATLRLLDPLKDGQILLTGGLDQEAADALFAHGATVDLVAE